MDVRDFVYYDYKPGFYVKSLGVVVIELQYTNIVLVDFDGIIYALMKDDPKNLKKGDPFEIEINTGSKKEFAISIHEYYDAR